MGDLVNQKSAIKIGKWYGAQYILTGNYSIWRNKVKIKLKCIDISDGTTIYADIVKILKDTIPDEFLNITTKKSTHSLTKNLTENRRAKAVATKRGAKTIDNAEIQYRLVQKGFFYDTYHNSIIVHFSDGTKTKLSFGNCDCVFRPFSITPNRKFAAWNTRYVQFCIFDLENDLPSAQTCHEIPAGSSVSDIVTILWLDDDTLKIKDEYGYEYVYKIGEQKQILSMKKNK